MFIFIGFLSFALGNELEIEAPQIEAGTQISVSESRLSLKVKIDGPRSLFLTHNPFLRRNKLEFKNRSKQILFSTFRSQVSKTSTKISSSDGDFILFEGDTKKRDHILPIQNSNGVVVAQFSNESTIESKLFRIYPKSFLDEPLAEVHFLSESFWLKQSQEELPFNPHYLISLLLFHLGDEKRSSSLKKYSTQAIQPIVLVGLLASSLGWLIP